MPYRYLNDVPTPEILAKLDAVIELLAAYDGEPIVAHEHPLHNAMVALEKTLQVSCDDPPPKQPSKLPMYMSSTWHRLLHASRVVRKTDGTPWEPLGPRAFLPFLEAKLLRFRELVVDGSWARAVKTVQFRPGYLGQPHWSTGSVNQLLRDEIEPIGEPPRERPRELE